MQSTGREDVASFGQSIQLSLCVRSKIQIRNEQTARKKKRVDAEGSVCDRLEEDLSLDDPSVLHVI